MQVQTFQPSFYGWKNAFLLTFIYMATTGLVFYAFSVIFPVMLKDTGWNRGDASIAITVAMLAGAFLIPLAMKLLNKYGSRKVIIVGLAILFVDLFILSTVISKLWQWILIWGIALPIGRMLCGLIPAQVSIMFWFNRKRAMAMGVLMSGAPIAGFFAPPLYTWFMEHMGGWRFGWMLSTVVVLVALVLSFWVRSKPSDMGQYPDGTAPGSNQTGQGTQPSESAKTYRTLTPWALKEVLKSRAIWMLTVTNIIQGMGLGLVINHGVLHLTDIGYDPMPAAQILSVMIICSGIVRFPIGWLADRIESRWIIFLAMILNIAGFVGFWQAPSFGLLILLGAAYGISYGTILTIMPTIHGNYYGPEVYASITGFLGPFVTIIGAVVPTIAGYAVESFGSYNEIFLVITILLVVGIACSGFLAPPQKKTAQP